MPRKHNPYNADTTIEHSIKVTPKMLVESNGDLFDVITGIVEEAHDVELEAELVEFLLGRAGIDKEDYDYLVSVRDSINKMLTTYE